MSRSRSRIESKTGSQSIDGILILTILREQIRQIDRGINIFWIKLTSLRKLGIGQFLVAPAQIGKSQIVTRAGILRIQANRGFKLRNRRSSIVEAKVRQPQLLMGCG